MNIEKGSASQPRHELRELKDQAGGGLVIGRGVGQGVVVEGFGRISLVEFDREKAILGIQDTDDIEQVETHTVKLGKLYEVIGTDYKIGARKNPHYSISIPIDFFLDFPRDIKILKDELVDKNKSNR